jgi:tol-pal system protein YbgF
MTKNPGRGGMQWLVAVLLTGPVLCAQAQDPLPDRRVVRAPVVSGFTGSSSASEQALRQSLLDLQQQLEQMQSEQRQLRDTVEVQAHELDQLKSRQRDLLADIDRRLSAVEQQAPAGQAPGSDAAAPGASAAPATSAAPTVPPTAVQQQEYEAAFDLMKQGYYERAIKSFRTFVAKYPNSTLADNAQYWIAEGSYVLRNYKVALEEFGKVLSLYPKSPKLADSLLKIGYVQYELGAHDKARKSLADVVKRYPNTTAARLAATRLEKMKKEGK